MFNVMESIQLNQEQRAPSQQVFYYELVNWDRVDQLVFLTEPSDHAQIRQLILETLDHVVLGTILEHLPETDHEEFLVMCKDRFGEPQLLVWLEEKTAGISDQLEKALAETKDELEKKLQSVVVPV